MYVNVLLKCIFRMFQVFSLLQWLYSDHYHYEITKITITAPFHCDSRLFQELFFELVIISHPHFTLTRLEFHPRFDPPHPEFTLTIPVSLQFKYTRHSNYCKYDGTGFETGSVHFEQFDKDGYNLVRHVVELKSVELSFEVTAKVSSRDNELRSRVIMLTQSKRRWAV